MSWPKLRPGLLADLGFDTPADLADFLHYDDVAHLTAALDGTEPQDDLMTALLRQFPSIPAMYFVETNQQVVA